MLALLVDETNVAAESSVGAQALSDVVLGEGGQVVELCAGLLLPCSYALEGHHLSLLRAPLLFQLLCHIQLASARGRGRFRPREAPRVGCLASIKSLIAPSGSLPILDILPLQLDHVIRWQIAPAFGYLPDLCAIGRGLASITRLQPWYAVGDGGVQGPSLTPCPEGTPDFVGNIRNLRV